MSVNGSMIGLSSRNARSPSAVYGYRVSECAGNSTLSGTTNESNPASSAARASGARYAGSQKVSA
jgi:hypothetical protein